MRAHTQNPEHVLMQKQGEQTPGRTGKRGSVEGRIALIKSKPENKEFLQAITWMYGHLNELLHPRVLDENPYFKEIFGEENVEAIRKKEGWTVRQKTMDGAEVLQCYARDLAGNEKLLETWLPHTLDSDRTPS